MATEPFLKIAENFQCKFLVFPHFWLILTKKNTFEKKTGAQQLLVSVRRGTRTIGTVTKKYLPAPQRLATTTGIYLTAFSRVIVFQHKTNKRKLRQGYFQRCFMQENLPCVVWRGYIPSELTLRNGDSRSSCMLLTMDNRLWTVSRARIT